MKNVLIGYALGLACMVGVLFVAGATTYASMRLRLEATDLVSGIILAGCTLIAAMVVFTSAFLGRG